MNKSIQNYLKKLCLMIKKQNRKATYTEIRNHFLDQIDSQISAGTSQQIAEKNILTKSPNPYVWGYQLRRAQQPFIQRHIFEISALTFGIIFLMAGVQITMNVKNELGFQFERLNSALSDQQKMNLFESDLKLIAEKNELNQLKTSKKSDAFNFVFVQNNENLKNISSNYNAISDLLNNTDANSSAVIFNQKLKLLSVDLEWVQQIKKFDYIKDPVLNIPDSVDLSNLSRTDKYKYLYSMEQPLLLQNEFGIAVQLFALKNCLNKKCNLGQNVYRHAAILLNSADQLTTKLHAISLLKSEKKLFSKMGYSAPTIDENLLKAYQRVQWGWVNINRESLLNGRMNKRWEKYINKESSFCTGVRETSFGLYLASEKSLSNHWPMELNLSQQINAERQLLRQFNSTCEFSVLNKFSDESNENSSEIISSNSDNNWMWSHVISTNTPLNFDYSHDEYVKGNLITAGIIYVLQSPFRLLSHVNIEAIPYLRTLVGVRAIYAGVPIYWKIYESKRM